MNTNGQQQNGVPGAADAEPAAAAARLSFARVADIERLPEADRWLIEGFLTSSSITVLASHPKTGKTWLALSLAVAAASGAPALGRFHVPSPGPVLLFHAEDDPRAVRERIESISVGQGLAFDSLPIHLITADSLRLDDDADRASLEALIAHLRPKLLILDPLVRLHAGAESYVGHVAALFGYLRTLQRRFEVAILLTHHAAKNRSSAAASQPGQAMRGSGDIHAAYDHGATLQRRADGSILLTLEHRSAPSPEPIAIRIVSRPGGATSFEIVDLESEDDDTPSPARAAPRARSAPTAAAVPPPRRQLSIHDQVVRLLERAEGPLSQVSIRKALQVRNETLTAVLRELEQQGAVENLGRMKGWRVPAAGEPRAADAGEAAATA